MFLPSHIGIAFDYHGGREIWYNADMRKVAMLKVLRKAIMVIAASIVPAMASSEVMVQQNITLKRGWNAVYIEVAPTVSPDEAFADWPVKSAGFYDPASFLATRQFSQTWESQGLSMKPVATWYRGVPEASQMKYVPAGTVCIAFNTNDEQTVVSVMGVPAAPRMTWHVTDTNEVYNFRRPEDHGVHTQHCGRDTFRRVWKYSYDPCLRRDRRTRLLGGGGDRPHEEGLETMFVHVP